MCFNYASNHLLASIFFMVQKAINSYYHLLDKRMKEGTFIILIISFLVFAVGILSTGSSVYKWNLHEYNNVQTLSENNIVVIDGIRYKVVLEEVK